MKKKRARIHIKTAHKSARFAVCRSLDARYKAEAESTAQICLLQRAGKDGAQRDGKK